MGMLDGCATFDGRHELAIFFAGQNNTGSINSLWVYDAYANDLARMPAQNPPPVRDGAGVCYDEHNDCLVAPVRRRRADLDLPL
jgi:hypothetical protein